MTQLEFVRDAALSVFGEDSDLVVCDDHMPGVFHVTVAGRTLEIFVGDQQMGDESTLAGLTNAIRYKWGSA